MTKILRCAAFASLWACSASAQELVLDITGIDNDTDGIMQCEFTGTLTNNSDVQSTAIRIFAVRQAEFAGMGLFDNLGETAFQSSLQYRLVEPGESKDARLELTATSCDQLETIYIYRNCDAADTPDCTVPMVVNGLDDFTVPVVFEAPPAQ